MSEKIPENVVAHLQECSAMVGRYEDEAFNQNVWWNLEDFKSPIEQLFYTAICTIRRLSGNAVHGKRDSRKPFLGGKRGNGLSLESKSRKLHGINRRLQGLKLWLEIG